MTRDLFDPRLSLTRDERARLRETPAAFTETMVVCLFAERETAETFAAMFGLLKPEGEAA